MPQINLLASTLGKGSKKVKKEIASGVEKHKPSFAIYYPVIIFIVVIVIVWIVMGFKISRYKREYSELEHKEAGLAVEPQRLIKLNEQKNILTSRLDFLEKLTEKRFQWSVKLNRINELIPDGIWLTEIVTERKITLDPITKKPQGEHLIVSIRGRAVSAMIQDAIDLVGIFHDKLKNDEAFSGDFKDINLSSVTKGIVASRDIMNFEFDCIIE